MNNIPKKDAEGRENQTYANGESECIDQWNGNKKNFPTDGPCHDNKHNNNCNHGKQHIDEGKQAFF